MTVTTIMLIMFAGFVVIGLVTGVVMGRRGRGAWMWGVLGTVFGPLVVPLLVFTRLHSSSRAGTTGARPRSCSGRASQPRARSWCSSV